MGYPVNPPSEQQGGYSVNEFRDPSTTQQTLLLPSGALSLLVHYVLIGGTAVANQCLRLVINASSDADAIGKLATANSGRILVFPSNTNTPPLQIGADSANPIVRLDFLTEAAASSEKTILQFLAGVRQ